MNYYIASCSCGKDSLAMVLRLIEECKPLNEIIFYDTGMEFNAIYTNWEKLKQFANACGIKCTTLQPKNTMLFDMTQRSIKSGKTGYGWCGGLCRWGTTFKVQALEAYARQFEDVIQYIGIAFDKTARLHKDHKKGIQYPLADWAMTEADCLRYCYEKGFSWYESISGGGQIDLYTILDRVSCWCCRNKNLWELYNIWRYLYDYWCRLRHLQHCIERPFKTNYSIIDLETRFDNGYRPKHIRRRKQFR